MFDFASDGRDEGGTPGINDKGLVTQDRKVKKDAFYLYQANWTDTPMVHVCASRLTPRKLAQTEIKVYSNCPKVELKVNGKSLGTMTPDDLKIARWTNVQLQPGVNHVEVIGNAGNHSVANKCDWTLE